ATRTTCSRSSTSRSKRCTASPARSKRSPRSSRDSVRASMRKPRRASEFDFELLLQLMLELKVLTEEQRKLALTRERLHRTRLTEAPARRSLGLRGADLSPIELLASFQFPDA